MLLRSKIIAPMLFLSLMIFSGWAKASVQVSKSCRNVFRFGAGQRLTTQAQSLKTQVSPFTRSPTLALNEAFVELLVTMKKDILAIPVSNWSQGIPLVKNKIKQSGYTKNSYIPEPIKFYPLLENQYIGSFTFGFDFAEQKVPFTSYNIEVANKLALSFVLFEALVYQKQEAKYQTLIQEHREVLNKFTYAQSNLRQHVLIALASLGQSLSQMTAQELLHYKAEDLLGAVTESRESNGHSLVSQLSLALGPGVLGSYGYSHWVNEPLDVKGDRLVLSKNMILHARMSRKVWQEYRDPNIKYEHGEGCPVGYCSDSVTRPPLQEIIDGIMHIYRQIPNGQANGTVSNGN